MSALDDLAIFEYKFKTIERAQEVGGATKEEMDEALAWFARIFSGLWD